MAIKLHINNTIAIYIKITLNLTPLRDWNLRAYGLETDAVATLEYTHGL
jgi:hypothetical protein